MPDHKKLFVLKKLTTLIEGATYQSKSLSGAVFRGRNTFDDSDPPTMVSLLEGIPTNQEDVLPVRQSPTRKVTWTVLCQGWAKDDPMNPSDAVYELLGAVEEQLAKVTDDNASAMIGSFIHEFVPGNGIVRPAEKDVSTKAFFYIPIRVTMAADLSKPWVP